MDYTFSHDASEGDWDYHVSGSSDLDENIRQFYTFDRHASEARYDFGLYSNHIGVVADLYWEVDGSESNSVAWFWAEYSFGGYYPTEDVSEDLCYGSACITPHEPTGVFTNTAYPLPSSGFSNYMYRVWDYQAIPAGLPRTPTLSNSVEFVWGANGWTNGWQTWGIISTLDPRDFELRTLDTFERSSSMSTNYSYNDGGMYISGSGSADLEMTHTFCGHYMAYTMPRPLVLLRWNAASTNGFRY